MPRAGEHGRLPRYGGAMGAAAVQEEQARPLPPPGSPAPVVADSAETVLMALRSGSAPRKVVRPDGGGAKLPRIERRPKDAL